MLHCTIIFIMEQYLREYHYGAIVALMDEPNESADAALYIEWVYEQTH